MSKWEHFWNFWPRMTWSDPKTYFLKRQRARLWRIIFLLKNIEIWPFFAISDLEWPWNLLFLKRLCPDIHFDTWFAYFTNLKFDSKWPKFEIWPRIQKIEKNGYSQKKFSWKVNFERLILGISNGTGIPLGFCSRYWFLEIIPEPGLTSGHRDPGRVPYYFEKISIIWNIISFKFFLYLSTNRVMSCISGIAIVEFFVSGSLCVFQVALIIYFWNNLLSDLI